MMLSSTSVQGRDDLDSSPYVEIMCLTLLEKVRESVPDLRSARD